MANDLLSADQVLAAYPVFTHRHLQTLRSDGQLPFYLVRGRAFYCRADVEAYLASRRMVWTHGGRGRTKVTT